MTVDATQCGDTDLHVPHDECPGLDGTETDPDKPPRPLMEYAAPEGWKILPFDSSGSVVCGWIDDHKFYAYAAIGAILEESRG